MESCVGEWATYRVTISPGGAELATTSLVSAGLILSSGSFGLATEFPCMISSLTPIAFQEDFTGPAQMWLAFRYLEFLFLLNLNFWIEMSAGMFVFNEDHECFCEQRVL